MHKAVFGAVLARRTQLLFCIVEKDSSAIDPKLRAQIEAAGDKGEVQAVVLVSGPAPKKKGGEADERGPGGGLVDRVSKKVKEKPISVRYLPRMGAVVITASGRFMDKLVQDASVVSATPMDADMFGSAL